MAGGSIAAREKRQFRDNESLPRNSAADLCENPKFTGTNWGFTSGDADIQK